MSAFKIDFVISNDGHHVSTFKPVIHHLRGILGNESSLRVISLCELRGLRTPSNDTFADVESIMRLIPGDFRKSPSLGRQSGSINKATRSFARKMVSQLSLKRKIGQWLDSEPRLVVLANDAAFPYDLICSMLRERGIPFLLVQEGIRFPLPSGNGSIRYGSGGALRIAAWGEASADYFRGAGAENDQLRLTGCPRFDCIAETDWLKLGADLRDRLGNSSRVVALLTNPIDDQGFCSTGEKLNLIASFVRSIAGILEHENSVLAVKLHSRESADDYRAALKGLPVGESIHVLDGVPLYPLLGISAAAVTMASTAGLEALLFGLPLGVLKIPGAGYVHDYVGCGAAWGLEANGAVSDHVREMLNTPHQRRDPVNAYLERQISQRMGSANSVAAMIQAVT